MCDCKCSDVDEKYVTVPFYKTLYMFVDGRVVISQLAGYDLVQQWTVPCTEKMLADSIRHANPPPSANPAPKE